MADQSRSSIKESFPSEKKAQRGIRTTMCLVNRIRKVVCLKLGKEIEKDGFRLVTSVVQRKKFPIIPHEESNLRALETALRCSTTEPRRLYGEQGPL